MKVNRKTKVEKASELMKTYFNRSDNSIVAQEMALQEVRKLIEVFKENKSKSENSDKLEYWKSVEEELLSY